MPATEKNLPEFIVPHLQLLDEELALEGVPVRERPFKAARQFVRLFLVEVKAGPNHDPKPPGQLDEFAEAQWFQFLFGHIENWYRDRYGARMDDRSSSFMRGVTLIASTPFELHVPLTRVRPGVPGKTIWLSFPDQVLPDEDVTEWLINRPTLDSYESEARSIAITTSTEVGTALRTIASRLMGIAHDDPDTVSLLAGVKIHLHSAAALVVREGQEGGFTRAQWELQMAVESAFKGVIQQHTGTFPQIHDLFMLFDEAAKHGHVGVRGSVGKLPRWNEAANLRYGLGDTPTIMGIFEWYKDTLRIIGSALAALKRLDLSQAEFEIKKAPWLGDR